MFIRTDIGKAFGVELVQSSEMNAALELWDNISSERPPWRNLDDDVRTYNMGKHISDYRARLVCLDTPTTATSKSCMRTYMAN